MWVRTELNSSHHDFKFLDVYQENNHVSWILLCISYDGQEHYVVSQSESPKTQGLGKWE